MSVDVRVPETAERVGTYRWLWVAGGALLLAGVLFRVLHLDADPAWRLWGHHITDEGRWTEQARRLVLFGSIDVSHWRARLHLLLAPLFQATTWVSFSLFGPGFASARAASALSGSALVVAGWLFARARFGGGATLATLAILALQPELVQLSRAAIPEMPALLFSFISFATVLSAKRSRAKLFTAGVLTLVAAGFKATVAPLAPILALVAALTRPADQPRRLEASAWYLAGLAVPLALVPIGMLLTGHGVGQLFAAISDATYFVRLDDPYGTLARYFYSPVVATLGPLFLACWLIAGLLIAGGRPNDRVARDAYVGSSIWIVGLLIASSAFAYFPDRYILHVIVPLAVNVGAGISMLRDLGIEGIRRSLARLHGARRVVLAFWLAVPVAWLLGPSLVAMGELAGLDWTRLRYQLVLLVALIAAVSWLTWHLWEADRLIGLAALSFLAAAFRLFLIPVGVTGEGAFWRPSTTAGLLGSAAVVAVAAAVLTLVRGRPGGTLRVSIPVFVLAVLGFWLSQELRPLLTPTYTARDAAAAIEAIVEPGEVVATVDAAGVLLPTRIQYTERIQALPRPDLFLEFKPVPRPFLEHYSVIGQWDLDVSPYRLLWGDGRITLYRRTD